MEEFLETYERPSLNQEEIGSLNRTITSNEIELAIGNLMKENLRPNGFIGEFYQTF